ncbi:Type III effector HopPmaJ [hydrothermal vent metagenome]|uniref:Type III effector HopPmaJ n=1 Tax=hydrothermal vent metagenome TaxID=652676 RepID=A0A3B0YYB5_9ZZZZ
MAVFLLSVVDPSKISQQDIASGRLIPLFKACESEKRGVYAIYPHRKYLVEKVRLFVDFLVQYFATTLIEQSNMTVDEFINKLKNKPEEITFNDTMTLVDSDFDYIPSRFINGTGDEQVINEAGNNAGSCKIFALGKLLHLNEMQTLHCFGDYYREDVLKNPNGKDHANIRNFIQHGWSRILFDSTALSTKE